LALDSKFQVCERETFLLQAHELRGLTNRLTLSTSREHAVRRASVMSAKGAADLSVVASVLRDARRDRFESPPNGG
jgi:hypothetical protein